MTESTRVVRAANRGPSAGRRRSRPAPRHEPVVPRSLAPLTPPALVRRRRIAPRVCASTPLGVMALGVVLAVVAGHGPGAVVGYLLVGTGAALGTTNVAVGDPRRMLGSEPSRAPGTHALDEVANLLEGLCLGAGLAPPRVRVVDDPSVNAMTLGWSERAAVLVVTSGLLERCDRIELEGVIAHELAHLKRGDVRDAAFATVALGAVALVSPAAAGLVGRLLAPDREAGADLGAVAMTRFPPGLLQALTRAEGQTTPPGLRASSSRLAAPLWLVGAPGTRVRARRGQLSLDERIGLLAEL